MLEREKEIEKKRVTAQYCVQGCYSLEMWDNAATILTSWQAAGQIPIFFIEHLSI